MLATYDDKVKSIKAIIREMDFALEAGKDYSDAKKYGEPFADLKDVFYKKEDRFLDYLKCTKTLGYISDDEQTLLYNVYFIKKEKFTEEN